MIVGRAVSCSFIFVQFFFEKQNIVIHRVDAMENESCCYCMYKLLVHEGLSYKARCQPQLLVYA
jgi:hypothetical protein